MGIALGLFDGFDGYTDQRALTLGQVATLDADARTLRVGPCTA